jgi:hypothetical protein
LIWETLRERWVVLLSWARERPAKDAARPREMKVFILEKKVNAMNVKVSECDEVGLEQLNE